MMATPQAINLKASDQQGVLAPLNIMSILHFPLIQDTVIV